MTNPLPTECKDLAFARNLIKQMKGEGGRRNSGRTFNRIAGTPAAGVVTEETPSVPMQSVGEVRARGRVTLESLRNEISRWPSSYVEEIFNPQGPPPYNFYEMQVRIMDILLERLRVEGRWGNFWIRAELRLCDVGDVCHVQSCVPDYQKSLSIYEMEFKKIGVTVTPDDGQTWHEEYFWERVS